jgi:hypothetical protein
MTSRPRFRRCIAWFLTSETPTGLRIPARLGARTVGLALLMPLSTSLTMGTHQPVFFFLNAVALVMGIGDDLFAQRTFRLGMYAGRYELTNEIVAAWRDHDVQPAEYVYREVYADAEEVADAARRVRRSTRGRPHSSG